MSVPFIAPSSPSPAPASPVSPALASAIQRAETSASRPTTTGFDAALAAETSQESTTATNAEDLVGTRIRAPEGGCGCDALVAATVPDETPVSTSPSPPVTLLDSGSASALASIRPGDVVAGDVLMLSDQADLSGRLHHAIVRNATEMIAANRSGMIEVLSIPWARVAGVR